MNTLKNKRHIEKNKSKIKDTMNRGIEKKKIIRHAVRGVK